MAKKAYGGVNNIARNGIKIYGGVNNIARKIVKGYAGVNDVARQFWPAGEDTQEGMSPSANYVAGGIYDFDVCLPVMALKYALNEYQKVNLASLKLYGVYDVYKRIKADIITHFLANKGDANVIKISLSQSTYSGGATYIVVNWDNVNTNNRQISTVTKDMAYGTKYAALAQTIWLSKGVQWIISHTDKSVRYFETSNSLGYIGMRIDQQYSGSYGTGHNLDVSNLGMTMYSVSMIYDWYWNFNGSTGMADQVDGLMATKINTDGSNTQNAIIADRADRLYLPCFLWEKGRRIEITLGTMNRPYTEIVDITGQDVYWTYYAGSLFGIASSAGYGSSPGTGFVITQWDTAHSVQPIGEVKSNIRGKKTYGYYTGLELDSPNALSGAHIIIDLKDNEVSFQAGNYTSKIEEGGYNTCKTSLMFGKFTGSSFNALYQYGIESVAVSH